MQRTLPVISVNGIVDGKISPLDRGFAYGDGVFETCRVKNSTVLLRDLHWERLTQSCKKIHIPIDIDLINQQITDLMSVVAVSDLQDAVLKITVTRGEAGRGYNIVGATNPTVVIGIFPKNNYPESYHVEGISVKLCNLRLGCNPAIAGLKHLNRLEQILARTELENSGCAEGILLDANNNVIEGVFSNLFFVKKGALFTPDLSSAGVAGVVRRFIVESLAKKLGINVNICVISLSDLCAADEIFFCNSLNGIWPVATVLSDKHYQFQIGPISIKLQQALSSS